MDDPNEKITFIDTVFGLMKRKNVDIYVTGSNSKMLSREVLTQFRDRGDEIHVFPLSFREFLAAYEEIHASGNFMGGTRKKKCVAGLLYLWRYAVRAFAQDSGRKEPVLKKSI